MHLIGEQAIAIILFVVLTLQDGSMMICTGRFLQVKPEGKGEVMAEN